ncbi:MAG: hypothetical protein M3313_14090 [Actinomycetota bacterium]|nr:hypothetical protein [Actinomycetota bacterium]
MTALPRPEPEMDRTDHPPGVDSERLLLDTAALRRRQLCAAFLHGSARSWRIRRRIWPAALSGVLIVALVIAALVVATAFARQQDIDDQRQSRSIGWTVIGTGAPCCDSAMR